jgi:hypothetical protein
MEDTEAVITTEIAEWYLNAMENLTGLALESSWERWYWIDTERILLEAANLTLPVFLKPETLGLRTIDQIAADAPMMLRAWENTPKLYLSAHYHSEDDGAAPWRYFVDVTTAEHEIAEWFVEAQGGGKIRSRDDVLSDLWPCPKHPEPLAGSPSMAGALDAWERGDDEIQHVLARDRATASDQLGFVKDRRAKLRWGMIPGVESK